MPERIRNTTPGSQLKALSARLSWSALSKNKFVPLFFFGLQIVAGPLQHSAVVGLIVVRQTTTGKHARRFGRAGQARPVIVIATLGTASRGSTSQRLQAVGVQPGGLVAFGDTARATGSAESGETIPRSMSPSLTCGPLNAGIFGTAIEGALAIDAFSDMLHPICEEVRMQPWQTHRAALSGFDPASAQKSGGVDLRSNQAYLDVAPREGIETVTISMHQSSVRVFTHFLGSLSDLLDHAANHAEARKIDPAILLNTRLYPNMYNLTRQVGEANRHAVLACALLAGVDPPVFPDTEPDIPELKARIAVAREFVGSIEPAQINGAGEKQVVFTFRNGSTRTFTGQSLLLTFSVPQFFFHVTTAYDILRHCGVELIKKDFLGRPGQ